MLQAVVSNPQPVTASLGAPCRPGRGSVRVRSTRNGSADNLDHLRRPPTATARQPRQGNGNPPPRRRVIQTTPFGLWDSFPDARTLDQMMRTMERIMDEADDDDGRRPFVVPAAAVSPAARRADDGAAGYRRGRTPWEIKERAGDYLVRFDMPGMTREDVRVSVQDRTLVVVAEKAAKQGEADREKDKGNDEEEEEEEEAWPAASYGRYRTRVELPENVEVERIAAEVRDGVLYLNIPKVSPSGGKVVSIQIIHPLRRWSSWWFHGGAPPSSRSRPPVAAGRDFPRSGFWCGGSRSEVRCRGGCSKGEWRSAAQDGGSSEFEVRRLPVRLGASSCPRL